MAIECLVIIYYFLIIGIPIHKTKKYNTVSTTKNIQRKTDCGRFQEG